MRLIDPEQVESIARIMGPGSSAQLAMNDYHRRIAKGEDASIYIAQSTYLVGPTIQGGGDAA